MRVSAHPLQEDREHQKLVVSCRCGYQEDVDPSRWCVYRNEVHHTSKERTVILRVSHPASEVALRGADAGTVPPVHMDLIWRGMLGRPSGTSAMMSAARAFCRTSGQIPRCHARAMCGVRPAAIMKQFSFQPAQRRCAPAAPVTFMGIPGALQRLSIVLPHVPTRNSERSNPCTLQGMTLFFNCTSCNHRWRDYV